MLDFSCKIFVLLCFVISARIPVHDSDSVLPKSDEKLWLILLSTCKRWFRVVFKIEEQFNFLFSSEVQKN